MPIIFTLHVPISCSSMITVHEFSVALCTLCLCTSVSASNPLRIVCTFTLHSAAHMQRLCLSSTRCWFRQLLVIYRCLDKGGGVIFFWWWWGFS